eukprot:TRINITY_DN3015_c0_g2_i1.p1 TRINITY_DN3015_c0_g2~~TRINITY_DN3015_c0_g2_i1.p1  ORF type:complete len:1176 (+),score=349.07 TRINITY_DN3015_c0_g2_i1:194-3721(+)
MFCCCAKDDEAPPAPTGAAGAQPQSAAAPSAPGPLLVGGEDALEMSAHRPPPKEDAAPAGDASAENEDEEGDRWCGDSLPHPLPKSRGVYTGDGIPLDAYVKKQTDAGTRCSLASRPAARAVRFRLWNEVFEPGNLHKAPVHTEVFMALGEDTPLADVQTTAASFSLRSSRANSVGSAEELDVPLPLPPGHAKGTIGELHADGTSDIIITELPQGFKPNLVDPNAPALGQTVHRVPAARLRPVDNNAVLGLLQGRWYDGAGSAWDVAQDHANETTMSPAMATQVHALVTHKPHSSMVSIAGHRIRSVKEGMVVWKNGEVWRRAPGFVTELSWEDSSVKWGDTDSGVVVVGDPGAKGGELKVGDILHSLDGLCVLRLHHLCEFVRAAPEAKLKARICRGGSGLDVPVTAPPDENWHPSSLRIGDKAFALWGGRYHPCTVMGGVPQHSQATLAAKVANGRKKVPMHERTFSEPFDYKLLAQKIENPLSREAEDDDIVLDYFEDDNAGADLECLEMIPAGSLPIARTDSFEECASTVIDSMGEGRASSLRQASPSLPRERSASTGNGSMRADKLPPLLPQKSPQGRQRAVLGLMASDDATVVWDFDTHVPWKVPMAYLSLEDPHSPVTGAEDPARIRVQQYWKYGTDLFRTILSYCGKPKAPSFTGAELLRELRLSRTAGKHDHLEGFQFREHQAITLRDWQKWVGYLCEVECAEAYFEWMEGQLRGEPPFRPPPSYASGPLGEQPPIADKVLTEPGRGVVVGSNGSVVRKRSALNSSEMGFIPRNAYVDVVEISGRRARLAAPMLGWISLTSADGTILVAESPAREDDSISLLRVAGEPLGFHSEGVVLCSVEVDSAAHRCGMQAFIGRQICAIGSSAVAGPEDVGAILKTSGGLLLVDVHFLPPPTVQLEYRKLPSEPVHLTLSPSMVLEGVDVADLNHDLFSRYCDCLLTHIDSAPVTHPYQLPLYTAGATAPVFTFVLIGEAAVAHADEDRAGGAAHEHHSPAPSDVLLSRRREVAAEALDATLRSVGSHPSARSPTESLLGSPAHARRPRSMEDLLLPTPDEQHHRGQPPRPLSEKEFGGVSPTRHAAAADGGPAMTPLSCREMLFTNGTTPGDYASPSPLVGQGLTGHSPGDMIEATPITPGTPPVARHVDPVPPRSPGHGRGRPASTSPPF